MMLESPQPIPEYATATSSKNIVIKYYGTGVTVGVMGAGAATLTFMVGGCESIPPDAELLFSKMGFRIVNCGKSGMGQATKLCNNMLLGTTMAAVAETMNLGIQYLNTCFYRNLRVFKETEF